MQPNLLFEPLRLAGAPILRLQSDERLVRLVRAGSHPAFTEVVHRYRPALVRYTGRLVGAERAEDVVQQALASAHAALLSDERPIDLKPWLYRIAHNAALNLLRGDREILGLDDHEEELVGPSVETQAEQRERFRSILRAMEALPAAQRDALLLRELEGRSHEEIAAALGVSPGAARQHLMRARVTMRAAVTALTPYPVIIKFAALGAGGAAGLPAAEAMTGAGVGATLSKLGAGVLAAGAVAGGAGVVAPAIVQRPPAEPARGAERAARAAETDRAPVRAARAVVAPSLRKETEPTDAAVRDARRAAGGPADDSGRLRQGGGSRGRGDEHRRRDTESDDVRRGRELPSSDRDGASHGGESRGPRGDDDRGRSAPGPSGGGPSPSGSGGRQSDTSGGDSRGSGGSGPDSEGASGSGALDSTAPGGDDATSTDDTGDARSGGSGSGGSGSGATTSGADSADEG